MVMPRRIKRMPITEIMFNPTYIIQKTDSRMINAVSLWVKQRINLREAFKGLDSFPWNGLAVKDHRQCHPRASGVHAAGTSKYYPDACP